MPVARPGTRHPGLLDGGDELPPDVVVTDVRMPPTSDDEGIQAAAQLRRSHPKVGVVVLSHYAEPSYATTLLAEGSPDAPTCSRSG